jgi:hypothetical protein
MSDKQQIENTIQTYFDCMYESNAEKAHEVFLSNAKITGYIEDSLREITVTDFANLIGSQQPSAKEKGESLRRDILSIEIAGKTAVARVRDDFLGSTFLDTLSLIKDDGKWCIYNKLFHVEGPSG